MQLRAAVLCELTLRIEIKPFDGTDRGSKIGGRVDQLLRTGCLLLRLRLLLLLDLLLLLWLRLRT